MVVVDDFRVAKRIIIFYIQQTDEKRFCCMIVTFRGNPALVKTNMK